MKPVSSRRLLRKACLAHLQTVIYTYSLP